MTVEGPRLPITALLADFALAGRWQTLPSRVQTEAVRAFLNWLGCALGGSTEPVVDRALAAVRMTTASGPARVLGRGAWADTVSAAFLNCLSSSALAYDDTHLATITHPTGPVASALLSQAQTAPVNGETFLTALALGIEIECRLSNTLLLPPAQANLSLFITGITGPVGAAAAVGRLMGLDAQPMRWAMGHAAAQAAGFRATHGAMSGMLVPAYAARVGLFSAHLAASGATSTDDTLESPRGLVATFAPGADLGHAVSHLGDRWELLANAYKPYPCGIVIQPAIDACREIVAQMRPGDRIAGVELGVHPLTLGLTDRRHPKDSVEAQISLYHWASATLLRGRAGIDEGQQSTIDDLEVSDLRARIRTVADDGLGREQARIAVTLDDGRVLAAFVEQARGCLKRPMSDGELDAKFLDQAARVIARSTARRLLDRLRGLAGVADVGKALAEVLDA